jgi:hypothetical protein
MSDRIARTLPRLRKVAGQLTVMSFGSGLFFLIKVGCLYLSEQIGLASWLSYLVINVVLTIVAWTYHSKVTFNTALRAHTAWRFTHATLGIMLVDYLGFLALTYAGHIYPVVSAIVMSGIQVGVRYLTYSTYVFHGRETPAAPRLTFSRVVLGIALLVGSINYALAIGDAPPQKDGSQYYCAAANMYAFGVFSHKCDVDPISGEGPQPTMKREPGLPALISLTFALADSDRDARACVATSPEWCRTLRTRQRMLLLLPFLALILVVYFAGYDITANANLAAAAALSTALGTGLVEGSMAFLTEPLAALLLLLVAWMLYRIACQRRPVVSGIVCGVALGLLALTKAVYFYFVPVVGMLALLALAFRSTRGAAGGVMIGVVIAALISGLWIGRNHERFGSNSIAERDGHVMSIRAAFTTMTWPQYWTGYLAFTPTVGPKMAKLLGVNPENVALFDRSSPHHLEQGLEEDSAGESQPELRQRALVTFIEHWPMELALIPLTIYRSAFLPVGFNSHHGARKSLPMRVVRLISLALATVVALGMMPAFLFNVCIDLLRLNIARLAFHLPALYSVGIHAVMTHYIPRYNLPLFGVFAIELCMAAAFLWSLNVGSGARSSSPERAAKASSDELSRLET